MVGKVGRLIIERENDNSMSGDKAAGQNVMEGIQQNSYSEGDGSEGDRREDVRREGNRSTMVGKGGRLIIERENDNSMSGDKAAGQNVMEGIQQNSYSEAVI